METVAKRLYEGMFLVDSALAASDWKGVNDAIEKVLKKSDAEIVSMRKWDDRRLAYEIKKKGRGTYILTYFNVSPDQLDAIERAVQLSEEIIRVLILRTDRMTADDMEKPTPAMASEIQETPAPSATKEPSSPPPETEAKVQTAEVEVVEAAEADAPSSDVKDVPDSDSVE